MKWMELLVCTCAKWPADISTKPDPLISRKEAEWSCFMPVTESHACGHLQRAISLAIYKEPCLWPFTKSHACGHLQRVMPVAIYRKQCLWPFAGSLDCSHVREAIFEVIVRSIQATYHLWIAPAKCLPSWFWFYLRHPWCLRLFGSLYHLTGLVIYPFIF